MNGSHAPELTDLLKEITEDIAKYVIKEGQPIILIDEYSWYTEVLSLMAKQVNLCDSCIFAFGKWDGTRGLPFGKKSV